VIRFQKIDCGGRACVGQSAGYLRAFSMLCALCHHAVRDLLMQLRLLRTWVTWTRWLWDTMAPEPAHAGIWTRLGV
jgi:hypothetical protein